MEEIMYVVDEKDQFVRKAARQEVIQKALLHRTARVIVTNGSGLFLVQKRSADKDIYPSHWDIGIAGIVRGGESYEGTAMRELMEEAGIIGISNIQLMHSFLFKIRYSSPVYNAHCKAYMLHYEGKIIPQKDEMDEVRFIEAEDVKELMGKPQFHPVGKIVFDKYLERTIINTQ